MLFTLASAFSAVIITSSVSVPSSDSSTLMVWFPVKLTGFKMVL